MAARNRRNKTTKKTGGDVKVPYGPKFDGFNGGRKLNKNQKKDAKQEAANAAKNPRKTYDDKDGTSRGTKKCLKCRRIGHVASECREAAAGGAKFGMCFNCGESTHSLSNCRRPKVPGVLPFAECFICNAKGHLSRDCPKNEAGLYPKGGSCHHCESVRHFAHECPENPQNKKKQKGKRTGFGDADESGDDDDNAGPTPAFTGDDDEFTWKQKRKGARDVQNEGKTKKLKANPAGFGTGKVIKF